MRTKLSIVIALLLASTIAAQEQTISFSTGVSFETGDTWVYEGRKFRLFGVQACLRGTSFRSAEGGEVDCGIRSVASMAALFATGSVGCQPVGSAKDDATFVICAAEIDGTTIDVGTALISAGAAFAAVFPSGNPVSSAYAVAEAAAKESKSGLWSGRFPHPVSMLLNQQ